MPDEIFPFAIAEDDTIETVYDGGIRIAADWSAQLLSLVQPVEERPFTAGIWQHFPTGRKEREITDQFDILQGNTATALIEIREKSVGPKHTIDIIGPDLLTDGLTLEQAGYRREGVEALMDRLVLENDADLPNDPEVLHTLTDSRIVALAQAWNGGRSANGYQPISPIHNTTPEVVQAYIEVEGEPAAYGRALVRDKIAFIADINSFPGFRHRGFGRSIMQSLHREIAQRDAERIVLMATAAGLPLYARLGYRALALDWAYVLQPEETEN